ncbi:hypothetical protein SETIT_2G296600v2 [Setaria italica]|uniref:Uncharacterized protein n=1 Tax=Setaria italica TaxID=4555 RepID=A0A368Q4I8_SETIT|nr:hypothetical protein SETIT_2G296600v2 [Setaria italica]
MVLRNAFSTSAEEPLLRRHMAYSMTMASQGSVIRPSLMKPNSSWDIRRSSAKTVYITQWPLPATELQHPSLSFTILQESRFLPNTAILCHFLAI